MATERLKLGNVRIAFAPGLWKADNFKGQGEKKFKVKLIVPPDHPQFAAINTIISKLAKEEWKEKGAAVLKGFANNKQKFCWIDGDNSPDTEGMPGNWVLSVSNKQRPTVKAADGETDVDAESGIVYSGCYVNALLEFRTQDHKEFGKGLHCTVRGVQFRKKGDSFSGGPPPAEAGEFDDLSTADEAEDDPTA